MDLSFPEMNLFKFCPKETEKDNHPEKVIQDFIDSFRPKEIDHREGDTPVKEPITGQAAGGAKRNLFGENSKKESKKCSVEKEDGRTRDEEPLFKALELNEATKRKIKRLPSKYQVKLFVITSRNDSPISLAMNSIVDCSQIMDTSNTTRSFMMFFYKDGDPDIFVMTSGPAYKRLQSRCCPHFPKRVARRVLEFKTIKIETRNVTGKHQQTRTIFGPNCPEVPNILDLIHVIVQTYTASPTVASSLYDLPGFENVEKSQFTITQWGLKAHTTLSITKMVSFITHVAKIHKGEETYVCEKKLIENLRKYKNEKFELVTDDQLKSKLEIRPFAVKYEKKRVEDLIDFTYGEDSYIYSHKTNTFIKVDKTVTLKEKDDDRFKWFELIQEEKDKQVIEELRKAFDESFKNDSGLHILLSLPDLTEWPDAGTFELYLTTKKKPEKTWERMPATLNQILDGLNDKNMTTWKFLQDDAKFTMQFKGNNTKKRNPITELLVLQMTFEDKPYFFWHGKWLKIKAEYISIVAHTFQNHLQKTSENILPLPWVFTGKGDNKKENEIESKPFKVKDLLTFMQKMSPKTGEKECMDLLEKKDNTSDETMTRTYEKHQYNDEDKKTTLMLIFLRINSNLVELLYNTTYILYDRFLSKGEGFIVGDQILTTNKIEMFDILKYDQETTYLIHVKDGFGQTVRDVCSQIKNSAKLLFSSMTSQSTRSMLEELWKTYTSEPHGGAQSEYRRATKKKMENLTWDTFLSLFNTKKRNIVYVLAVRDEKKEVKLEEEEDMEKALANHYEDDQTEILEALKKHDFVTDQFFGKYILTDKFRLQEKDFIQTMTDSIYGGSNYNWKVVLGILKKYLPGTQSTIAQLEIVELFDYFADHFGRKLTLKLFFLPTSLEDLEKAFV